MATEEGQKPKWHRHELFGRPRRCNGSCTYTQVGAMVCSGGPARGKQADAAIPCGSLTA